MISLVFWVISIVLVFQESPYWFDSILTISFAVLISIIKKMWDISRWATNQLNELFSKNITL